MITTQQQRARLAERNRRVTLESLPPVWPEMRGFRNPWEWLQWKIVQQMKARERRKSSLRSASAT